MANSPNFNWELPDDTDLVKDGASAMRTLGNAIDSSLVDLKGGTTGQVLSKASNTDMDFTWVAQDDSNAIQNAIVDAKGDLITATAADTPARLAVGTNGQYLIADSTTATGLKWGDVSAGAYTELATGTLSTNSVTISNINQGYRNLYLLINGAVASSSDYLNIRVNGITTSNAYQRLRGLTWSSTWSPLIDSFWAPGDFNVAMPTTANNKLYSLLCFDYATTGYKNVYMTAAESGAAYFGTGFVETTGAFTSITIKCNDSGRSFTGGTYTLWGIK